MPQRSQATGGAERTARVSFRAPISGVAPLVGALWVSISALILVPLGAIVWIALEGQRFEVLLDEDVLEASINSLTSAVGSALAAVLVGTALAIVVERTNTFGARGLGLLALTPLLMPPFVGAIAWLGIAGPAAPINLWWRDRFGSPLWSVYGADGVILLLTIHSYPLVMLIVIAALRRIPADLEHAARVAGAGPVRSVMTVTVPLLRPALLASFLLVAVGNLADFGIPSIIGLPERFTTLATLVYRFLQSGTVDDPLAVVASIGLVLLIIALVGVVLSSRFGDRGHEVDGSASRPERLPLGRARLLVSVTAWVAVAIVTVAPLLALLAQALLRAPGLPLTAENLTTDNIVRAVTAQNTLDGASNSIMLAGLAAIVCGVIGLAIGVVTTRTRLASAAPLRTITLLPQAIPGIVIAVAWLVLAPSIGLFNTPWLILCAYITSFIAIVVQAVTAPLAATPSSAEDAARIAGAGPLRALVDISVRLALPAALSGAVLVAVTAVRELTLSVLLLSPGSQTLGVAIFNLQQAGAFSTAAALSLIVAIVGIATIGLTASRQSLGKG